MDNSTHMKRIAGAAVAVAASSGMAMAANGHVIVGKIDHMNPRKHELTVRQQVYRYNPRTTAALRIGEAVKVMYRNAHGHRVADKIWPA